MMRSRRPRNFAQRSRIGSFAHAFWATRAWATIPGNDDAGVLSKCASTSPVAGLIEGSVSMGTAVAAISAILTDFAAGMCAWNLCSSAPCLGTGVRFLLIACLRCEQFQVFRLPEHRVVDPIPAAGVVEEH